MRIDELYQNGTYRLQFPIKMDGNDVPSIIDAKFIIYDTKNIIAELDMLSGVNFSNSTIIVNLTPDVTENLQTSYTYEVWIKMNDDNPYFVRMGTMQFNKTKARF